MDRWLKLSNEGSGEARNELISLTYHRLYSMAESQFRVFLRLKRHVETSDVVQAVLLKLHRALQEVKPQTARHFYSLAATQIRRELIDLWRYYFRPAGPGSNHGSNAYFARPGQLVWHVEHRPATENEQAVPLAEWAEFHQLVEQLPEIEREVFDLLWYQGLTQGEAASLLDVSERTVKKRWQSARELICRLMGGSEPGR